MPGPGTAFTFLNSWLTSEADIARQRSLTPECDAHHGGRNQSSATYRRDGGYGKRQKNPILRHLYFVLSSRLCAVYLGGSMIPLELSHDEHRQDRKDE